MKNDICAWTPNSVSCTCLLYSAIVDIIVEILFEQIIGVEIVGVKIIVVEILAVEMLAAEITVVVCGRLWKLP